MSGVGARGGGVSESLVASLCRGLRMCRAGVCNVLIASGVLRLTQTTVEWRTCFVT